jgi:hypothetical protein
MLTCFAKIDVAADDEVVDETLRALPLSYRPTVLERTGFEPATTAL